MNILVAFLFCVVGWLVGLLVGWLVGWLVGVVGWFCLAPGSFNGWGDLVSCSACCLFAWFVFWLNGRAKFGDGLKLEHWYSIQ